MSAVNDFPLMLELSGRRVLVVGGGSVAGRRVPKLLEAGAVVDVVAPDMLPEFTRMVDSRLTLRTRLVEREDISGAWLVYACTDDVAVNAAVAQWAQQERIFCVRADDATGGSARTPAVLRRGEVTLAITSGDDPFRSSTLRDAIGVAMDVGTITARPYRPARIGSVALVGGGPGDPELISVRGRRLVAEADVIVVDRLAPRELLVDLPDEVEVVDCGKSTHGHNLTQQQINELLVDRALKGHRVVRLKGGDPFVFGRGGEEFAACVAAGVDVSVVPGISSALAAPALANIPLTHRGVAADFAVISGHHDPASDSERFDWAPLAVGPATIVLLMGMEHLAEIARRLIQHGRPAQTPAAAIHQASRPGQQVVRASLDQIAAAVAFAEFRAPSVVVIGEVVGVLPQP